MPHTSTSLPPITGFRARIMSLAPGLILFAGLLLTLYFWQSTREQQHTRLTQAFEFQVTKISAGIETRLRGNEQILLGVSGLFAASDWVDRREFTAYINALQAERIYPGIQGIGFSRAIAPDELKQHIASQRTEGFSDYTLKPAGERDFYSAIVYLEPLNWRNQRALGFDMYSEPVRRAAMARARDTGKAAISGKVKLVQETDTDVQAGVLLYVPVYRQNMPTHTQDERRSALLGWAYSPLRMKDLLESLLEQEFAEIQGNIGLALYNGEQSNPAELLYQSHHFPAGKAEFEQQKPIQIAGQIWTLHAFSLPGFVAGQDIHRNHQIMLTGIALSLLLSILAAVLQHGQKKAKAAHEQLSQSEKRYRMLAETMQDVVWTVDVDSLQFTYCSPSILQLRGYTVEEVVGQPVAIGCDPLQTELLETSIRKRASKFSAQDDDTPRYYTDELEQPCQDGTKIWTEVITNYFIDNETGRLCLHGVTRNINERKRNEEERRIAAVAFESHESTVVTDRAGKIIRANRAFTRLNGYEAHEIIGQTLRILHSGRHEEIFYRHMWETISAQGFWQGEIWNRCKGGEISPQWLTITAVLDEQGQTTHYVGSSYDISQRVAMESEIRNMAFYDALTGLANRRLLTDRLSHAFAKSSRKQNLGAVIYIDLDRFKELNDHLGHAEGDRLLTFVADRLSTNVREGDTVARLGGDEFLVLLEDLSTQGEEAMQQAHGIAEKLRLALNQPYILQGNMPDDWRCTPSIGIALFSDHRETMESLLKRADHALYEAKHAGRNTIRVDQSIPAAPPN